MVFTMKWEEKNLERCGSILKLEKKTVTHTYLFNLLTFDLFTTTYLVFEGVQVWHIRSSTFAIYTTKIKDKLTKVCSSP